MVMVVVRVEMRMHCGGDCGGGGGDRITVMRSNPFRGGGGGGSVHPRPVLGVYVVVRRWWAGEREMEGGR